MLLEDKAITITFKCCELAANSRFQFLILSFSTACHFRYILNLFTVEHDNRIAQMILLHFVTYELHVARVFVSAQSGHVL